ncbi:16S rRNA (uracil(1498)-N(3))-methyltransferase [candidate division WOR-3 bacterium]|nr:16S rRNA (uracil(1498)-N(3))-methyltransferase [candidate division WOR-3 bacterium]
MTSSLKKPVFVISGYDIDEKTCILSPDEVKHAKKSLRLKPGEEFFATDCRGTLLKALFDPKKEKSPALCRITEIIDTSRFIEKQIQLTVACSVMERKRFELMVSKVTEIGATKIQPLISSRSQKTKLQSDRLVKIALSALKQSGRILLPKIEDTIILTDFISLSSFNPGECFYMDIFSNNFSIKDPSSINCILVGPEGGWTEEERNLFRDMKISPVSLGFTTLRTETAAIVGTAMALYSKLASIQSH